MKYIFVADTIRINLPYLFIDGKRASKTYPFSVLCVLTILPPFFDVMRVETAYRSESIVKSLVLELITTPRLLSAFSGSTNVTAAEPDGPSEETFEVQF